MSAADTPPLPSDDAMRTLLALSIAREMLIHPETGRMAVVLDDGRPCFVEGEALDELFARGWIEADDETKTLTRTEKGAYWLGRWLDRQRAGKRRRAA